jgi:glycosyltransferase involved in cell wall biosynthesis
VRVLFVIAEFRPKLAGAEVQAERLALTLAEQGVEVEVITRRLGGAPAAEMIGPVRITRLWSPGSERLKLLALMPLVFIAGLARRDRFDLVHAHQGLHPAVAGVAAATLLRKPSVVKIGNSGPRFDLAMLDSCTPTILSRQLSGYLVARTGCFIALNSDIRRDLGRRGVPSSRIMSIPNGVPVLSPQTSKKKVEARITLGLPLDEPIVTSVGNLHPKKNHHLLLEALGVMAKMGHRPLVFMVGQGPLRRELEEYSHNLGVQHQVRFVGSVSHVVDYLYAADAFVLPSSTEGVSNALLEAMSVGVPAVGSDISGNRELIEDSVHGFLVAPDDAHALAINLIKLLHDRERARWLGRNAHQRIVDHFDIRKIARQYHLLYRWLLGDMRSCPLNSKELTVAQASPGRDWRND